MPLYARNISAVTYLYLAILCLNTYKNIPIKGKETCNKLLSAFKAKPALYTLLNKHLNNPIPNIPVAFTGITPISYPGQFTSARY
ncbi:uncharacterized protein FFE2_14226 [Fusarium fujikuroi]|nr:uncharacterized protein FFE2_14226 [Fusarium fujikuroi]SCV60306.1 uncharacterized protein FFFS_14875 [Fusarium fujikuroi]